MSLFVQARRSAGAPAPSTWTQAQLGDETGNIVENSATSITFASQGTSEIDNSLFAYQTASGAGDIQVLGLVEAVGSWSGTPSAIHNFAGFGLQIRESLTGTPVYVQIIGFNQGPPAKAKHRLVTDGAHVNNYASGDVAQNTPVYLGITYDVSEGEIKFWESSTGVVDEYNQVGATLSLTLDTGTVYAGIHGSSHDIFNKVTSTVTACTVGSTITISDAGATPPARNIGYELVYPSGAILPMTAGGNNACFTSTLEDADGSINITNITRASPAVVTTNGAHGFDDDGGGSNPNGITIRGLTGDWSSLNGDLVRPRNTTSTTFQMYFDHPIPGSMGSGVETSDTDLGQNPYNTNSIASAYSGNGGRCEGPWERVQTTSTGIVLSDDFDMKTGTALTIGADAAVAAPTGSTHYMRGGIHYNKDYAMTPPGSSPHFGNSGKNKSRWGCTLFPGGNITFDYDQEFWVSVQVYVPTDFDDETGVTGSNSSLQLCDITENAGPSGQGVFTLVALNPNGSSSTSGLPGNYMQWCARVADIDLRAQNRLPGDARFISFGRMSDDVGNWVTFVFRMRINPTGTATTGRVSTYTTATNYFDEGVIGARDQLYQPDTGILQVWKDGVLVHDQENEPVGAVPHDTNRPDINIRMYKFGWHHNSTTMGSPIELGFGPVRYGITAVDGTGYADVHPTQAAQPA